MDIGSSSERMQKYWGPAATVAVVAVVEVTHFFGFAVPNPQLFTAVAVTFAAYVGGFRGGLLAAAIGIAYALHFFATPETFFSYTDTNFRKVIVNIVTLPTIAILVAKLNNKYIDIINNEVISFFANANAPIFSLDADGRVLSWNRYLEALTGYSKDDLLGHPIHEHPVFGGDVSHPHDFWALGMDRWHSEVLEIPLRSKSGKSIDLLANATTRRDRYGAYNGVFCIGQDITERKNAERRLSETMHRYQSLVDVSPDGVMVVCRDRIVFCNQAMTRMLGADSMEQLTGRSSLDFSPPEEHDVILQRRQAVRRGETFGLRETAILRLDGTRVDAERTIAGINWEGEEATLVLTRDISMRKYAEKQLRQVVESLQDGFILFDAADGVVMWNDKWREIHKCSADIIKVGVRFEDLIRSEVRHGVFLEAIGREEAFIQERMHQHRNPGEPMVRPLSDDRWIIIREARTADGGTFTINIDVTDIKNAEKAEHEARLRAESADKSKSEFLANMSHELRTPLNAVIGFSSVMGSESFGAIGNERYRNYIQYIEQSGRHLLSLISDILDLSKVEAGAEELHEEDVDALAAAGSAIRFVSERAQKEGVRIAIDSPGTLPPLRADPRKLNQILYNLLTNAIKFTGDSGRVMLAIRCNPSQDYVFEVSDTGIGIAPEKIPLVLSKFGQVDSSMTRRHEGSGLGLPLTKSLVELHGGRLEIESEVDVGTRVTVRFPANRIVTERAGAADEISAL